MLNFYTRTIVIPLVTSYHIQSNKPIEICDYMVLFLYTFDGIISYITRDYDYTILFFTPREYENEVSHKLGTCIHINRKQFNIEVLPNEI